MTHLVVGSVALKRIAEKLGVPSPREPLDYDAFSNETGYSDGDYYWHDSFNGWLKEDETRLATLDELYTIKVSHIYWELPNGSWNKHAFDIRWLKAHGAKLLPDLHALLYPVWEEKHGKKKVNLNMTANDFFTDAVYRKYDHDSLHASVAYYEAPLYERILSGDAEVAVDVSKIWDLDFVDQVRLFREEIYATALERILVPKDYKTSPGAAYVWALRRTITSLTKGRSALFIADNLDIFSKPDCDYLARHLENKDKLILIG